MMEVENYHDCLRELQKKRRNLNLLMGNGFSMAYDDKIFSYNALQEFIQQLSDPILVGLFKVVKSKNLEVIMRQLSVLTQLLDILSGDEKLKASIKAADTKLRQGLIDAVKALHPEHVFTVPGEQIGACYKFLEPYLTQTGGVFSTNYDILLYWVLMRSGCKNAIDGFGYIRENPEETNPDKFEFSNKLIWGPNVDQQNVHYLHGALHLFDNGIDVEKEAYDGSGYLLDHVKARMDKDEYPVFVTAGDGNDKLSQIVHNKYLEYCYNRLCEITGSLVVFGFGFGAYDEHIIEAINKAALYGRQAQDKLRSVYIGVYSAKGADYIRSIEGDFRCKVHMFDANSAKIWGK